MRVHARTSRRRALTTCRMALRLLLLATAGPLLISGCDDDSAVEPEDRIVEGVNFTELFAEPSAAEVNAMLAEWASRDVSARFVEVVTTSTETVGTTQATLRILSHEVDGALHYGAVLVPENAQPGSLPVLVYAHGGDGGVDIDDLLGLLPFVLGDDVGRFVFVAPSFRSEPLVFDGITYRSGGAPSPWDRDVDDALALIDAVLSETLQADPTRIGILGFSRGACVGLLMAIRDPRVDVVVEFFGPTDFFGPFVQDVTEEALRGSPRDLPGLAHLDSTFIQPLRRGEFTIADMRPELLRRSPVYFADRLPQLQVHHGTADDIVPVGEAERLISVMQGLGRVAPEFEHYLYEGAGHNPLSMLESIPRTRGFLERLLAPTLAAR